MSAIEQLANAKPAAVSARALRLLALALEFDEVKFGVHHLQGRSEELSRQIKRLQQLRTPSDWETRFNLAQAQIQSLKGQTDPLVEQANAIERQLKDAFAVLSSGERKLPVAEELSTLRAAAVYQAVNGSEQALALVERYRSLGGRDGWDAIAFAEYATNARVAPDTLTEARIAIERLRAADSAFILAYLLGARIALAQRDYEGASTWLEAAIALNPLHESAKQLLVWTEEARRTALAKGAEGQASER
jgi:hypothetical protein